PPAPSALPYTTLFRSPRQRAPARVHDRDADHEREARSLLLEDVLEGDQARLEVEGVEDGLGEQQIDAAVDEAADLLRVHRAHLVEAHGAESRVGRAGREAERPVQGSGR